MAEPDRTAAATGVVCAAEVGEALRSGLPVVALESTIISHGLPRPANLAVARELEALVRDGGACPATIAVLDGVAHVGLADSQLERVADDTSMRKLGFRDLAPSIARRASGATTVSATAFLASRCGIRVFGTGGLGGVHRGYRDSFDESADLALLSRTRVTVVSAGVKSILDIGATLQRLETLNVTVVGYRTRTFPAFYVHSSGFDLDWTLETPEQVARTMLAQDALDGPESALLVANPVPREHELDPALHDAVLAEALESAARDGVSGQAITPYLLDYMARGTGGASLAANLAAVRANVSLATEIACAYAGAAHRA